MQPIIRPFTRSDSDYQAITLIGNTIFPDYPLTVEQLRFNEASKDPKVRHARFLLELDDVVVGMATYDQDIAAFHPQEFEVLILVLPEFEGKGFGQLLHAHTLEALKPFNPTTIRTHTREDFTRAVRFIEKQGFSEEMKEWESRLNPQAANLASFKETYEKVCESGVVITSLAELSKTTDDWQQQLYELDWEVTLDIPTTGTPTKCSFEHFTKSTLQNPDLLLEGWFIAIKDGEWIGESALWKSAAEPNLYVGVTGVRRAFRKQGIARALKYTAVLYAKDAGYTCIKTWNEEHNQGMLEINTALGFEKVPAWIYYKKEV